MIMIQGVELDPILLAGFTLIVAFQYCLFRVLSARQRRGLDNLLQTLDGRIRRFSETERSELEFLLQRLAEEQRQNLDALRNRLVENELRQQAGLTRSDCLSGGRLDKRHQVMSLAQMGFDSRDISRKLRLSRGETELLLGLCERFRNVETLDGERAL